LKEKNMDFDKEMQRALEADGEKLRQLTGEDHGPHSLVMIRCRECGSEGRIYRSGTVYEPGCGHAHSGEIDCGPCPVCDGTGCELIECPLVTEEELP
jgi:rubrerythrin